MSATFSKDNHVPHKTDDADLDAELAALRAEYATRLPERIVQIERTWASVEAEWNRETFDLLHSMVHKLAGSGASFGFDDVSTTARALEDLLMAVPNDGSRPNEQYMAEIRAGLRVLKMTLQFPRSSSSL
jgi:chemotaxis protein histidine kinase CheA